MEHPDNLSQFDLMKTLTGGAPNTPNIFTVFMDFLKDLQETLDIEKIKSLLITTKGEEGNTENIDNVALLLDHFFSEYKLLIKAKPVEQELDQDQINLLTETGKTLAAITVKFSDSLKNLPKPEYDTFKKADELFSDGRSDTYSDETDPYAEPVSDSDGSDSGSEEFPEE